MTRFIFCFLFFATIAYAVDIITERVYNPDGDLVFDAKLGSYVKSEKTLKVDRIENRSGNINYPPGMVPIGGLIAAMPHISGSWSPPADCNTIIDGFMRAGFEGVACKVPTSCKDCIVPVGTDLPILNNSNYLRGNDISGNVGGINTRDPTENVSLTINDHPTHQHYINNIDVSNSIVIDSYYMKPHGHSTEHVSYNINHDHEETEFWQTGRTSSGSNKFAKANHKHIVNSGDLTAGLYRRDESGYSNVSIVEYSYNYAGYDNQHNYPGEWFYPSYSDAFVSGSSYNASFGMSDSHGLHVYGTTGYVSEVFTNGLSIPQISVFFEYPLTVDYFGGSIGSGCSGDTIPPACTMTKSLNAYEGTFDTYAKVPSGDQGHDFNLSSTTTNNEPQYFTVVWVMRVK